jgi:hypothetical protein
MQYLRAIGFSILLTIYIKVSYFSGILIYQRPYYHSPTSQ